MERASKKLKIWISRQVCYANKHQSCYQYARFSNVPDSPDSVILTLTLNRMGFKETGYKTIVNLNFSVQHNAIV